MFDKIQQFLDNVQKEMSKVSWPTKDELLNSSVIVVVVTILFSAFIFFSDFIISKIVELFY